MKQKLLFLLIFSFSLSLEVQGGFPHLCSCCKDDDVLKPEAETLTRKKDLPTTLFPRPPLVQKLPSATLIPRLLSSNSLRPNPITLATIKDAYYELEQANSSTIVFIDIDDTILESSDPTFQTRFIRNRYCAKDFFYEFEYFWRTKKTFDWYSNFIQQQKRQLVEPELADYIKKLQEKGATVLAITAINAGSSGVIPDIHELRHQELTRNGISFDRPLALDSIPFGKLCAGLDKQAIVLKRGILTSGRHSKGLLMSWFIAHLQKPPTKILFFDDNASNHEEAMSYLEEQALSLSSFFYTAASIVRPEHKFDKAIARIQLDSIYADNQYVSYEEAAERLKTAREEPSQEILNCSSSQKNPAALENERPDELDSDELGPEELRSEKPHSKEIGSKAILTPHYEDSEEFWKTVLNDIETAQKTTSHSKIDYKLTAAAHPYQDPETSAESSHLNSPDSTLSSLAEEMAK